MGYFLLQQDAGVLPTTIFSILIIFNANKLSYPFAQASYMYEALECGNA
jgi:hypothetical protein